MSILVISSPSLERQKNVRDQFASQSFKFLPYQLVPAIMEKTSRYGIAKSHKKCVRIAKDNNWSGVVILEDDVNFLHHDSLKIFMELIDKLPKDCDLFLGGIHSGHMKYSATKKGYTKVIGTFSGLHCYYLSARYYDRFLETQEDLNIDFALSEVMKARTYVAVPILVSEIPGFSFNSGRDEEYSKHICRKYRCIK